MKAALAIILLCSACSSGGHAKRPSYPPGYVLSETVLRGEVWERWDWTQATATRPAGKTVFEYRIAEPYVYAVANETNLWCVDVLLPPAPENP